MSRLWSYRYPHWHRCSSLDSLRRICQQDILHIKGKKTSNMNTHFRIMVGHYIMDINTWRVKDSSDGSGSTWTLHTNDLECDLKTSHPIQIATQHSMTQCVTSVVRVWKVWLRTLVTSLSEESGQTETGAWDMVTDCWVDVLAGTDGVASWSKPWRGASCLPQENSTVKQFTSTINSERTSQER